MKTVIVYASVHHGNTKKIVEAMAPVIDAEIVDITKSNDVDLSKYDVIGLASGVFYHSMHEAIKKLIEVSSFSNQQSVFTVTTCGIGYRNYASGAAKKIKEKGANYVGNFQCRGFDTFGPFEKIGGIAKNHPSDNDIENAKRFADKLK